VQADVGTESTWPSARQTTMALRVDIAPTTGRQSTKNPGDWKSLPISLYQEDLVAVKIHLYTRNDEIHAEDIALTNP
jgi:hypothetical protein